VKARDPSRVRVTVDGRACRLPEGRGLLEALDAAGLGDLDIPHDCWHPELGSDGDCRLCVVELPGVARDEADEGADAGPVLAPACGLPVREGLEVRTDTPAVRVARESALALLLVDHPPECAICDAAGECSLQDHVARHGPLHARSREPARPSDEPLAIGPEVVLHRERCVRCGLCIRFCNEVTGGGELRLEGPGAEARVALVPGRRLDGPYSMNVAELCPVGALTTRDGGCGPRAWTLSRQPALCGGCARGCNAWVDTARGRAVRLRARRNDAVNRSWLCDAGRLSLHALHAPHRQREAVVRSPEGTRATVSVAEAVARAAERCTALLGERGPGVAATAVSGQASEEDLYAVTCLLDAVGSESRAVGIERGEEDGLLRMAEQAPNGEGARARGFGDPAPLAERIAGGGVGLLLVLGPVPLPGLAPDPEALRSIETIVCLDTHQSDWLRYADVYLPGLHFHEKEGRYVNGQGLPQSSPAVEAPGWPALREGELAFALADAMALPPPDALGSWQWDLARVSAAEDGGP